MTLKPRVLHGASRFYSAHDHGDGSLYIQNSWSQLGSFLPSHMTQREAARSGAKRPPWPSTTMAAVVPNGWGVSPQRRVLSHAQEYNQRYRSASHELVVMLLDTILAFRSKPYWKYVSTILYPKLFLLLVSLVSITRLSAAF